MDKQLEEFFSDISPEAKQELLKYIGWQDANIKSLGDLNITVIEALLDVRLFGGSLAYTMKNSGRKIRNALYRAKNYLYTKRTFENEARIHELKLIQGADRRDIPNLLEGSSGKPEEEDYPPF